MAKLQNGEMATRKAGPQISTQLNVSPFFNFAISIVT
jgi:hypothetical protein